MSIVAQRSFASGEVGPAIQARADTVKYATGLRTCRNFFVRKHGGVSNRPGTTFISEIKNSAKVSRLIPYRYTEELTAVLEIGDGSIRGIVNGALTLAPSTTPITGITNANPCVVSYSGADNLIGTTDLLISGVVGPIGDYLNGRHFKIGSIDYALNTFTLKYMDGTVVNSTAFGAYTSGGTAHEVDQTTIPQFSSLYSEAEIPEIDYSQSGELLTLVHPDHPVVELEHAGTGPGGWDGNLSIFGPQLEAPALVGIEHGAPGAKKYVYVVTSVAEDTYEESLIRTYYSSIAVTTISSTGTAEVTTSGLHGLAPGNEVYIDHATFATGSINGWYTVSGVPTTSTFNVLVDSSGFGAFSGSGAVYLKYIYLNATAVPTTAAPIVMRLSPVTGAVAYNIYKQKQGIFGFIGTTQFLNESGFIQFNDEDQTIDPLDNPPIDRAIAASSDNYPAVAGVIQQRRAFAQTNNEPSSLVASRPALLDNFTFHIPLVADDSLKLALAGSQNKIKHILDLGTIVVLTSGGEWVLQGDSGGTLTPSQINPKQIGYNGASSLKPLLINNNALYVQARGGTVRDLGFDYQVDGYKGNDLTVFSSHLFEGFTITDWAYQQQPNSIVWAVRSDGVLLGMTYLKEQDIIAWHRHDTQGGTVESVCTIPEGEEDSLYMIVKRTIGGHVHRYIEKLNTRVVDDVVDSIFVDCAKSFDGRHTGATTMTLSGGTNWTYEETLTLTASASTFTAADVGKAVHLTGSDGTLIRFTIVGYTSATVVTGHAQKTVPAAMRAHVATSWALAIKVMTGLWHLEGEDVSVFADGFVVANPNNPDVAVVTVTNGTITLEKPYAVIHVGLPIIADIETLNIDTTQGESMADKKKLISHFTAWLEKSRGLWAGPKPPSDDDTDPLEGLFEMKIREDETQDEPVDLFTGTKTDLIRSEWNSNGRVFIRQIDPVPLSISAIAPSGMVPYRGVGRGG